MNTRAEEPAGQVAARLDDLSAHLQDLQALLGEEEDLDAVLDRLGVAAVHAIPGACQATTPSRHSSCS